MKSWPLRLPPLLTAAFALWQCAAAQSAFVIDSVVLQLQPTDVVESGTRVTLSCEVTVSRGDDLPLTHAYRFLRDNVPVYSKNSSSSVEHHVIPSARAAHSGTYACRVGIQDKAGDSRSEKLTVTGLQTPVLSVSSPELSEGERVTALCSAPEELGPLIFYFYANGTEVSKVSAAKNTGEATLAPMPVGEQLLGCSFRITMLPEAGKSNSSNEVKVTVRELDIVPKIRIHPSNNVAEGDELDIQCIVENPQEGISVSLTKDGKLLLQGPVTPVLNRTAEVVHSGTYVCKSEKEGVQKSISETVTVRELFSTPLLRMEPGEVFEGVRFTLTCHSVTVLDERIKRQQLRYALYKDGRLLAARGNHTGTAGPSLNGNYSCQAQAKGIHKSSSVLTLLAKVPVSMPVLSAVGTVIQGKPFRLLCHSANGSLPIHYQLLRGSQTLGTRLVQDASGRAFFTVEPIHRREDLREYSCRAQNNNRYQSQSPALQAAVVEPVSRPMLSVHPHVGDITEGHDVTLTCSVQQGTPPITFAWYRDGGAPVLTQKTINGMRGSQTLREVGRGQSGGYYCEADNKADDFKASAGVHIQVKLAGWKKGVICTVCILLIVAILIFILAKKGIGPFRKKQGSSQLTIKPANSNPKDPLTVGLTQDTVEPIINVSTGLIGRSVWSDNVSTSEYDNPSGEETNDSPQTQYAEVTLPKPAVAMTAQVQKGTDTVYSEVRNSRHSATDLAESRSREYAQLHHGNPESV